MEQDPWRAVVEQHFRVYEERSEPLPGGGPLARMYFVMFPGDELEARYEAVRRAVLEEDPDAVVFLRSEGGEDVLVIAPRPPVRTGNNRANWVLLALTILTTLTAGVLYWHGYRHAGEAYTWSLLWSPEHVGNSLLFFVLPLMGILGVHETAHFLAAKRHGLRASLPFFIPFPPIALPIGTLGAFIRLKDPLPDRKALFDVGASGPLAGFAVAIPVLVVGALLTTANAVELPDAGRPEVELDGVALEADGTGRAVLELTDPAPGPRVLELRGAEDDWSHRVQWTITLENGTERADAHDGTLARAGDTTLLSLTVPADAASARVEVTWDDGIIRFGDPLFIKGLELVGLDNQDYLTHPTFFAGWVGLLVTGINLLPAGQLDGGHVARAVFGERMRYVAYFAVGALFYFAFQFQTWILMAIFILLMGIYHPPPLNDRIELDWRRKLVAAFVLVVFALTFVPRPIIL